MNKMKYVNSKIKEAIFFTDMLNISKKIIEETLVAKSNQIIEEVHSKSNKKLEIEKQNHDSIMKLISEIDSNTADNIEDILSEIHNHFTE